MDPETWVPLAEVARPHGVKGEIRLRLFNKTSDTLLEMEEVLVRLPDGEEHEVSVERARRADDAILMKLYSVDDRDKAEDLRGALVCIKRKDFPATEDGEFYAVDVVGSEVRVAGARIGVVEEILSYPSVEALRVKADDGLGDWEIPLAEHFIAKVDAAAKVVEIASLDDLEREPPKKPKAPRPPRKPRKRGASGLASEASGEKEKA